MTDRPTAPHGIGEGVRDCISNPVAGLGGPLAAAATTVVAFFAAGRFDPTHVRLGFELFGTAVVIGALWPRLATRTAWLSFTAVGLFATGLQALNTSGAWCWLGAGLAAIGLVDAHHLADSRGHRLAPWPAVGAALAAGVVIVARAVSA